MSARRSRTAVAAPLVAAAIMAFLAGCASPSPGGAEGTGAQVADSGSPSPSADTPTCPNPHGGRCLGLLEAGEYETTRFEPQITYTVPEGWMNMEDLPGNFLLYLEDNAAGQATPRGGSYLGIYQNTRAAAINCMEQRQDGVGHTPADLAAWYASVPGLVVSEPVPVTVGGLAGLQIDLSLEEGDATCNFAGEQGIPLIIGNGVSDLFHVILDEMDIRLVFLEWNGGNVTLEITNVREQHSAEEFRAQMQPIVDSLGFAG